MRGGACEPVSDAGEWPPGDLVGFHDTDEVGLDEELVGDAAEVPVGDEMQVAGPDGSGWEGSVPSPLGGLVCFDESSQVWWKSRVGARLVEMCATRTCIEIRSLPRCQQCPASCGRGVAPC